MDLKTAYNIAGGIDRHSNRQSSSGGTYAYKQQKIIYLNTANAIKKIPISITLATNGSGYSSLPTLTFPDGSSVNYSMALTATTLIAPSVATAGNDYTSVPTVAIVGGNSTLTSITLAIQSIKVLTGGLFSALPTGITLTGGGSGATQGTISVVNYYINRIDVASGGNYSVLPTSITLSSGGATTQTTLGFTTSGTAITSVYIVSIGSPYTLTPTITINGGTGTAATFNVYYSLANMTFTSGGTYTLVPTLSYTGGTIITNPTYYISMGVGACAISAGSGYTTLPSFAISGGGGSGFTLSTPILSATTLASITVAPGSYINGTSFTISGGGGSPTQATFTTTYGKIIEYEFKLPNTIDLYDQSVLKVMSIFHTGTVTGIHTFKLKNISYDTNSYINNDKSGYPTVATVLATSDALNFTPVAGLTLLPQTISSLTIIPTDSLSDLTSGVANGTNFMFILSLEINDVVKSRTDNQYL